MKLLTAHGGTTRAALDDAQADAALTLLQEAGLRGSFDIRDIPVNPVVSVIYAGVVDKHGRRSTIHVWPVLCLDGKPACSETDSSWAQSDMCYGATPEEAVQAATAKLKERANP